jgi:hypothetical protein
VVEKAKTIAIHAIMNGRKEEDLSEAEKAQIQRLRMFTYQKIPITADICRSNSESFFSLSGSFTIGICPTKKPNETNLLFELANAMGIILDPCHSSQTVYKVDKTKINQLKDFDKKYEDFDYFKMGTNFNWSDSPYIFENELYSGNQSLIQELLRNGALSVVSKEIPVKDYPSNYVLRCLAADPDFKIINDQDLEDYITDALHHREEVYGSLIDSKADAKSLRDAVYKNKYCNSTGKPDQSNIAVRQVFASRIVGEYFAKNRDPSFDLSKAIDNSFIHELALPEDASVFPTSPVGAIVEGIYLIENEDKLKGPPENVRATKLVLNDPSIRRSLGCSLHGASSCLEYTPRKSSSQKPSEGDH